MILTAGKHSGGHMSRVTYRELHVRPMKRKWASCSSRGRLSFDADLPKQPAAFRAKVIVHELLHFKVPNHGKLFSALLRSYLPADPSRRPRRQRKQIGVRLRRIST